jgi:hypothetical protein
VKDILRPKRLYGPNSNKLINKFVKKISARIDATRVVLQNLMT